MPQSPDMGSRERLSRERLIYYNAYSNYTMNSTIQLSKETKDQISSLGAKGETYEEIIKRMYQYAIKEQLREFLMSSKDTITLEEAKRRHAERWPE